MSTRREREREAREAAEMWQIWSEVCESMKARITATLMRKLDEAEMAIADTSAGQVGG